MAVKDLVVYSLSQAGAEAIQLRSSLHRAWSKGGFRGVLGRYPVAGENLPAILVKDISATVKNLHVFLPGDASGGRRTRRKTPRTPRGRGADGRRAALI